MSGVSGYVPLDESGYQPPLLKVNTENVKKGKGMVEFSSSDGKIVQVAASNIREAGGKKGFHLFTSTVEIKAEDQQGKLVRLSVTIGHLAKALGVKEREIRQADESGNIEAFIENKLGGKPPSEKALPEPSPITKKVRFEETPTQSLEPSLEEVPKKQVPRPVYPKKPPPHPPQGAKKTNLPEPPPVPERTTSKTPKKELKGPPQRPPPIFQPEEEEPPLVPPRTSSKPKDAEQIGPPDRSLPELPPKKPPRSLVSNRPLPKLVLEDDAIPGIVAPPKPVRTRRAGPTMESRPLPEITPRDKIIAALPQYGLTREELGQIEAYYADHKAELEALTEPIHIRKESVDPHFPRSLVYVPEGPRKGLYILLKSKGGVKEIGLGSFNRATKAIHLESGQLKVFRDGKAEGVFPGEFVANQRGQQFPDLLAAGVPVRYRGPWRTRQRPKNVDKSHLPRERDVEKVGFIMDWMEGGELFDQLAAKGALPHKEAVGLALKLAKGLRCMHDDVQMAHLDLKPENVFMTNDGEPKISDFGMASPFGENSPAKGTPGYIPPEMIRQAFLGNQYTISSKADIWSFGCMLAELIHGGQWYHWTEQANSNFGKVLNSVAVDLAKGVILSQRGDPNHLDNFADRCLNPNPDMRPSAAELVAGLEALYQRL